MENANPDKFRIEDPDDLFNEFKLATNQICDFLKIEHGKTEYLRYETKGKGLDYIASNHEEEKGFTFHITTYTKNENVIKGKIIPNLTIYNSDGISAFYFDEELGTTQNFANFLQRWVSLAWFQYNKEVLSDELTRLFYDTDVRVYGIPNNPTFNCREIEIFLRGITSTTEKLTVCKFNHIRAWDMYRQYSFAFLASRGSPPLWIFFLQVGSPDSGGAKIALDEVNAEIEKVKKKIKVEIKEFDIDYDKLESYLLNHSSYFEKEFASTIYENSIFKNYSFKESDFGEEFLKNYEKMVKHYENKDWRSALHELRPLVQHALKITCERKNVIISDINNQSISNLTGKLIGAKFMDGRLQKWSEAFAHDPNESTHTIFPTELDLIDETIRRRIFLSFQVGLNILSSLKQILNPSEYDENMEDYDGEYEDQ